MQGLSACIMSYNICSLLVRVYGWIIRLFLRLNRRGDVVRPLLSKTQCKLLERYIFLRSVKAQIAILRETLAASTKRDWFFKEIYNPPGMACLTAFVQRSYRDGHRKRDSKEEGRRGWSINEAINKGQKERRENEGTPFARWRTEKLKESKEREEKKN